MKGGTEARGPYPRVDWLTLLRGFALVPAEEAGRGKLLRGVLGADDDDPLMVGLT